MSHPFVLHDTLGALFLGLIVASTLLGVSVVQAWYYYGHTHQNDMWATKLLVATVMTFDIIHQALISHSVYTHAITTWGEPSELNKLVRTGLVEIVFTGCTAFIVQSFLTFRIWRLSKRNIWLTGIAAVLILGEFASLLSFFALAIGMDTFTQMAKLNDRCISVNALTVAADVFIAAVLCILLHRSRTGFDRSNTIINKLIVFVVSTGALTSLCAIAALISIVVAPKTAINVGFFFCIGRLYTNSLLATLNARKTILKSGDNLSTTDVSIVSSREFPRQGDATTGHRPTFIPIQINTEKEFVTTIDQDYDVEETKSGSSTLAQGFSEKNIV